MTAIAATNNNESLQNLNLLGLGYKMSLTRFPLVVTKAVLITSPRTGDYPNFLAYITLVPPYRVYFQSLSGLQISFANGRAFLITGMLSPVSMLSFTMQEPVRRTRSQGILQPSGISMTSPGTNSVLSIYVKLVSSPDLITQTGQLY